MLSISCDELLSGEVKRRFEVDWAREGEQQEGGCYCGRSEYFGCQRHYRDERCRRHDHPALYFDCPVLAGRILFVHPHACFASERAPSACFDGAYDRDWGAYSRNASPDIGVEPVEAAQSDDAGEGGHTGQQSLGPDIGQISKGCLLQQDKQRKDQQYRKAKMSTSFVHDSRRPYLIVSVDELVFEHRDHDLSRGEQPTFGLQVFEE